MGGFANMPVALAPGLGLNAYFAYNVVCAELVLHPLVHGYTLYGYLPVLSAKMLLDVSCSTSEYACCNAAAMHANIRMCALSAFVWRELHLIQKGSLLLPAPLPFA